MRDETPLVLMVPKSKSDYDGNNVFLKIAPVAARTIIELNIKHYRDLLRSGTDAARAETIAKPLAEEEAKLAKLLAEKSDDK